MEKRVAYYAHHHGSGHLQHARDFAETVDYPLLVVSTRKLDTADLASVTAVQLPDDIVEGYVQPANSAFHYTPNSPKIQARFQSIAAALKDFQPDVVIVDVSVEVATFVKLLGYPVVYRLMHGNRNDLAHDIAYRLADDIIAYYPETIEQSHRPDWVLSKTTHVGMRQLAIQQNSNPLAKSICVITSTGAEGVQPADIIHACSQTPDYQWTIIGNISNFNTSSDLLPNNCTFVGFVDNPDTYLSQAEIIVSSSGHNAVARSVAFNKPVILFAEERPFDEQHMFATEIANNTDIAYVQDWHATDWKELLSNACKQNTQATRTTLLSTDKTYGNYLKRAIAAATSQQSTNIR